MSEQDIDINFNPLDFVVPGNWLIDDSFWEHLDENSTIPSNCKTRFYIPQIRAKKGWPEKLKQYFNIGPWLVYDPKVINLPDEITAEEIEEHRKGMNKYLIKSREDMTPVPPPEKLDVRDYLRAKSTEIMGRLCWSSVKWEDLTEKEQRIYQWKSDYGFLWDHRDGSGVLFPQPKDLKALKFEVINEYFFYVRDFPSLILSVGCEPNSDRAIYGFRREASMDWPPDKIWNGWEYDENKKPHPKYINFPDETVEKRIVLPINNLLRNLEYTLSN